MTEEEQFSHYELMPVVSMFSFVGEFSFDDPELFVTFAELYDITVRNNSLANDERPPAPIYEIFNENLYNRYQFSEYPISLVTKRYIPHDENGNNRNSVTYAEITRFHDNQLKANLNNMLVKKAMAGYESGSEHYSDFFVTQYPSVYENYLSVQQSTTVMGADTYYGWNDCSAVTVEMEHGEIVNLGDLINVDEKLREKIMNGEFRSDKYSHEECVEQGIYNRLWDALSESADAAKSSQEQMFYLTVYSLVFILPYGETVGECTIFQINYENLSDIWLQPEGALIE